MAWEDAKWKAAEKATADKAEDTTSEGLAAELGAEREAAPGVYGAEGDPYSYQVLPNGDITISKEGQVLDTVAGGSPMGMGVLEQIGSGQLSVTQEVSPEAPSEGPVDVGESLPVDIGESEDPGMGEPAGPSHLVPGESSGFGVAGEVESTEVPEAEEEGPRRSKLEDRIKEVAANREEDLEGMEEHKAKAKGDDEKDEKDEKDEDEEEEEEADAVSELFGKKEA